jgi:Phosphoenolpyruvate hydrolase-like
MGGCLEKGSLKTFWEAGALSSGSSAGILELRKNLFGQPLRLAPGDTARKNSSSVHSFSPIPVTGASVEGAFAESSEFIFWPPAAEYVLHRIKGVHGFYGASSMECLPVEKPITETMRAYKAIRLKG